MMKTKILFLLIVCQISILAQGSGSIYSRFGLGEDFHSFSARRLGMGELGFALSDQDYLNYSNPASLNMLGFTRIETGIIFKGIDASNSKSSAFHGQSVHAGAIMGFPVSHSNGIGVAFGLVPLTNVAFNVTSTESNPLVGKFNQNYSGDGGLSKLFIASSYRLPFGFSLGASLDYYTGKITHETVLEFTDSTSYQGAIFTKEYLFRGLGVTTGIISSNLAPVFGIEALKDFRFGISYTPSAGIFADTSSISTTYIGSYSNDARTVDVKMPAKLGIGAYINLNKNYSFTLDYYSQSYSKFSIGGVTDPSLSDVSKFSLGFEYRPEVRFDSYWDQIMYRAGISTEKLPYKANGVEVNQFSVYAGLSLPLGYENTIDLGFQYGRRGTTDNNLVKENIYKLYVTISLGDLWFIQTER